jgi:2-keto-4-pentenoate hydratase
LLGFPGPAPDHLSASYAIQKAAIAAWPGEICGWKVGRILGDLATLHATDRLIGPIFAETLQMADAEGSMAFDAIEDGFCAVEAELVFKLAADGPIPGAQVSAEEALDRVSALHIGIEIAGSPLASINDLGPCVVVSDFGNNAGLLLGPELADWRSRLGAIKAETWIDGQSVGTGCDAALPGGVVQSLVFALNQVADMGLPIKAGMLVSTGALSGVQVLGAGQAARCTFGPDRAYGVTLARCIKADAPA